MDNKIRLIEANLTKKALKLLCEDERASMTAITYFALMDLIDKMPTIEVESVKSANWISVKNRLPKLFEDVLTYYGNGKILINWLEEFEDGIGYFAYGGKAITYWMPLPELPKESDTE